MDTNLEVIRTPARRGPYRHHPLEFKRAVVEETLQPGASVALVARKRGVNANQVFHWRKLYREGLLGDASPKAQSSRPTSGMSSQFGTRGNYSGISERRAASLMPGGRSSGAILRPDASTDARALPIARFARFVLRISLASDGDAFFLARFTLGAPNRPLLSSIDRAVPIGKPAFLHVRYFLAETNQGAQ